MDGSFSESLACAESAPHLPSYLTAGAEQWNQTGPSLAARVVLSFGAAMFTVPLSPRRRGSQTLRDTACFTPSPGTFLPRPLTRCIWGGAELFVGIARAVTGPQNAPKAVFSTLKVPKSGEGLRPFEPWSKGGTPPLRNHPCPTVLAASAAKRVATFFGNFYWTYTEDGLSRPFPSLVRGSNEVGGAWDAKMHCSPWKG